MFKDLFVVFDCDNRNYLNGNLRANPEPSLQQTCDWLNCHDTLDASRLTRFRVIGIDGF